MIEILSVTCIHVPVTLYLSQDRVSGGMQLFLLLLYLIYAIYVYE